MPIDPVALANAGGLALAAALVMGILVGAVRGWWVAGFVYQREVDRADKATASLATLNHSLDGLADELRRPITRGRREAD